ncbi:MAG: hypothetical protein AAF436_07635 [Myxococcota bacterium]
MGRPTTKQVLLELLRVSPRPMAARQLVGVGKLLGFEENATRVALARLVQKGLLENHDGQYALTDEARSLGRWVEGWRRGDRRLRPWKRDWLCVLHPQGVTRTPRRRSHRALERLGFREGLPKLWVRPNNLLAGRDAVELELVELGLAEGAELFVAESFSATVTDRWVSDLWPIATLRANLTDALDAIAKSKPRLETLPTLVSLVESFQVGSGALRQLVRDPLLPDEIHDGSVRRELTRALQDYDRIGKTLWSPDRVASAIAEASITSKPKARLQ